MKLFLGLLFGTIFLLVGCGRSADSPLATAENIMSEQVDSALSILNGVDRDQLITTSDKVLYGLLYTQAQLIANEDVKNDTLVKIAVDYYSNNKNIERCFQSLLVYGKLECRRGNMSESVVAITKAEQLINEIDNTYLIGELYTQFGDVYSAIFDYEKSLEYYLKAKDFYSQPKDIVKSLLPIALCYWEMGDFENSERTLLECKEMAIANDDKELEHSCIRNLAVLFIEKGDIAKAVQTYDYIESQGIELNTAFAVMGQADVALMKNKDISITEYMNKAIAHADNRSDSITLLFHFAKLAQQKGEQNLAVTLTQQGVALQNSALCKSLKEPIKVALNTYYKKEAQISSLENMHVVKLICIVGEFILVLVLAVFGYMQYKKKIKLTTYLTEEKIKRIDNELQLLDNTNNSGDVETEKVGENIRVELLKLVEIKAIDRSNKEIVEGVVSSPIYQQFKEASTDNNIKLKSEDWNELENIVLLHYPRFKTLLRMICCNVSEHECHVCLLTKCGFSNKEIATLTFRSPSSVTNTLSRLFEKIFSKKGTASEMRDVISLM